MAKEKRSFFERLTGTIRVDEDETPEQEEEEQKLPTHRTRGQASVNIPVQDDWREEEQDGELSVDVYQTADSIIIKTIVAGVNPDELDISIARDMVTIKGRREVIREVTEDDYFYKELYWGGFSRTIMLPEEIEVEEADATQKHGLLTITLPKIDKARKTKLKVKTV